MKIEDKWQRGVIPRSVTVLGSGWGASLRSCSECCDLSPSTASQVSEPTVPGLLPPSELTSLRAA